MFEIQNYFKLQKTSIDTRIGPSLTENENTNRAMRIKVESGDISLRCVVFSVLKPEKGPYSSYVVPHSLA